MTVHLQTGGCGACRGADDLSVGEYGDPQAHAATVQAARDSSSQAPGRPRPSAINAQVVMRVGWWLRADVLGLAAISTRVDSAAAGPFERTPVMTPPPGQTGSRVRVTVTLSGTMVAR